MTNTNEEFSSLTRDKDILDQKRIIVSDEGLCPIALVKNNLISMVPPIKFQKYLHICKFSWDDK